MGKMFFYDIMYLYKAYEDSVNEENKRQQEQQESYENTYDPNQIRDDAMSKYKIPDINSITRGMTNSIPKFSVPKI